MRFKRSLSFMLAAMLAVSSLPISAAAGDVAADTAVLADVSASGKWKAVSGKTVLDVTEVDETSTGASDTLTYDRLSDISAITGDKWACVMAYRVHGSNYSVPSELLLKPSTTYAVSFYARAMADVNEAWNADSNTAKASNDNKMTIEVYKGYMDSCIGEFELTEEWQYFECTAPIKTGTSNNFPVQFIFTRSSYGGEDVVPIDIDKVTFTEVNGGGTKIGNPIVPPAEWRTDLGGAAYEITKADEVYSHVELPTAESVYNVDGVMCSQTSVAKSALGDTVAIVGDENTLLTPGAYKLSGEFRLGWFDHSTVTMASNKIDVTDFGNNR